LSLLGWDSSIAAESRLDLDVRDVHDVPSTDPVLGTIPNFFSLAASRTLTIDVEPVPLTEVESTWNRVRKGQADRIQGE
jgi:hypothetical protein